MCIAREKLTRGWGTKATETLAPKEGVIVKLRIVCLSSRRRRAGQERLLSWNWHDGSLEALVFFGTVETWRPPSGPLVASERAADWPIGPYQSCVNKSRRGDWLCTWSERDLVPTAYVFYGHYVRTRIGHTSYPIRVLHDHTYYDT